MRLRVPRSDTAFLQRECAVVSEQVSIMEETIGNAANRLFSQGLKADKFLVIYTVSKMFKARNEVDLGDKLLLFYRLDAKMLSDVFKKMVPFRALFSL